MEYLVLYLAGGREWTDYHLAPAEALTRPVAVVKVGELGLAAGR